MKILQINTFVNSGSTGRIAEEIGLSILEEGWKSYIAYGRNDRPSESNLIKVGNSIDVKVNGVLSRLFDNHGFGVKKPTEELVAKIKEIKPDIIHLHNIHGYFLNIEILFKYLENSQTPVVWTLHDCWSYTGHCAYYTFVDCIKWKTECGSCPQINAYPASLFVDNSKNNFLKKKGLFTKISNLTIVTVSDWLKREVEQSYLSSKKIKVINNGVNLDVFKPSDKNVFVEEYQIKDKFIILGVANVWEKRKGLEYFIKLSDLLKEDEIIFLVGLTENQLKTLPKNVKGITRTENTTDLALLYTAANVYFNPTLEDNFPTTNLEALACGTPVITFNTGGSPESVTQETGYVVPRGDIKTALGRLREIKKNKNNYESSCREIAVSKYNKDNRFKDYITLYNEILKAN